MILTGVTLTGADESVEPRELIEISDKFPFVEWGILVGSRGGSPRFPSGEWIGELADQIAENRDATPVRLSLHICGSLLRAMKSEAEFPIGAAVLDADWGRAQLNFHGDAITQEMAEKVQMAMMADWIAMETIVQLDGVNDWFLDSCIERGFPRMSGLYDRSHGAGVKPDTWPQPNPKWEVGYAGGLGPENIGMELRRIADAAGSQRFWIDMETKLRSDHDATFDLHKCRCVLDEVSRAAFNSQLICRR